MSKLTGTAGQSLRRIRGRKAGDAASWKGEANDYVGKGLSGGKIIIYPPARRRAPCATRRQRSIIVGNVGALWRDLR